MEGKIATESLRPCSSLLWILRLRVNRSLLPAKGTFTKSSNQINYQITRIKDIHFQNSNPAGAGERGEGWGGQSTKPILPQAVTHSHSSEQTQTGNRERHVNRALLQLMCYCSFKTGNKRLGCS